MLITKESEIKITNANITFYKTKGYLLQNASVKKGETLKITVKVEDLPIGSATNVRVKCDYCDFIYETKYKHFMKRRLGVECNQKDACRNCEGKKKSETHRIRINTDNDYKNRSNIRFSKAGLKRRNTYDFVKKEFEKAGYKLIEKEYVGNKQKMRYLCPVHGEQSMNYHNLMSGKRCPCCANDTMRKSQNDFVEEVKNKFPFIDVVGEYKNNNSKIRLYCNECREYFYSSPRVVLSSVHGCGSCARNRNEKILYDYIKTFHDNIKRNIEFDGLIGTKGGYLSYDMGMEYNGVKYLIERQGEQHDYPVDVFGGEKQFIKQQEHDKRKREYAKENGYELIEIWYYDDYKEKLKSYGLCKGGECRV